MNSFWGIFLTVLIGLISASIGAIVTIYTTKRTTEQAAQASKDDERVELDKAEIDRERVGIEGLTALAEEYRKDRTQDRAEMAKLRERVNALEEVQRSDTITIKSLQHSQGVLSRYVQKLKVFIKTMGSTPPEPDEPLDLGVY